MGKSKNVALSVITITAVLVGLSVGASPATAANETATADLAVTATVLSLDPGGQGVQKFIVTNLGPGTLGPSFRVTFAIVLPEHVLHIENDPYASAQVYFLNNATGYTERIDCSTDLPTNIVSCPSYSPFGVSAAPGWTGTLSLLVALASDAPAGTQVTGMVNASESTQFGAVWTDNYPVNNYRVPFAINTSAAAGTPAVASLPTAAVATLFLIAFCVAVFRYRRRVRPQIAGRSAA